jgi:hypothetical protein
MASKKMSAHRKKFSRIAKKCQAQVKSGGKARAKAVGACMKKEFKK